MPLRAFLDTCVINWFLDAPEGPALLAEFIDGTVRGVVSPEVSEEICATPDDGRRGRLKAIPQVFFPVSPTLVPVANLARSGVARSAPAGADALRDELKSIGFRKLDILHLINAHYSKCDLFITKDKEDILKISRKAVLETRLAFRILHPADLLIELTST